MRSIRIGTQRFVLRPLTPDDASERYAGWFDDIELKRCMPAAAVRRSVDAPRDEEDPRDWIRMVSRTADAAA